MGKNCAPPTLHYAPIIAVNARGVKDQSSPGCVAEGSHNTDE